MTCCISAFDVDAELNMSPRYSTVIEWLPTDSVDIEHDALPLLKNTGSQEKITDPLSKKITSLVGD